jgi:hypothetical protein
MIVPKGFITDALGACDNAADDVLNLLDAVVFISSVTTTPNLILVESLF